MDKKQWEKIGKGALIAVFGALLSYAASSVIPQIHDNFGVLGPAIAALASILINIGRKWTESMQSPEEPQS